MGNKRVMVKIPIQIENGNFTCQPRQLFLMYRQADIKYRYNSSLRPMRRLERRSILANDPKLHMYTNTGHHRMPEEVEKSGGRVLPAPLIFPPVMQ